MILDTCYFLLFTTYCISQQTCQCRNTIWSVRCVHNRLLFVPRQAPPSPRMICRNVQTFHWTGSLDTWKLTSHPSFCWPLRSWTGLPKRLYGILSKMHYRSYSVNVRSIPTWKLTRNTCWKISLSSTKRVQRKMNGHLGAMMKTFKKTCKSSCFGL